MYIYIYIYRWPRKLTRKPSLRTSDGVSSSIYGFSLFHCLLV